MLYTEEDFVRMKTDPQFERQYFWNCATKAKIHALKLTNKVNATLIDKKEAERLTRWADAILENLDFLVGLNRNGDEGVLEQMIDFEIVQQMAANYINATRKEMQFKELELADIENLPIFNYTVTRFSAMLKATKPLLDKHYENKFVAQKIVDGDIALLFRNEGIGIGLSGQFAGWQLWKHPDGQWVSNKKLEIVSAFEHC